VDLLERDDDLTRLTGTLPGARRGGALVLLGGEAGVGKTAFLRAVAERLQDRAEVLWGDCDPLSTPQPLAPVLDFAPALLGRTPGEAAADALARDTFFRAVLERLDGGRAHFVVIEDVHWADEATLDLLRFLSRRLTKARVLLVCSYRDDGLGPRHPLRLLLGHLDGAPSVERLHLEPLSAAAVRTLSAGTGLDAAELHRRTGGNAFYVTEVVAGAVRGRGATPTGAEPSARARPGEPVVVSETPVAALANTSAPASNLGPAAGQPAVPATVRDAVLARAAALDEGARAVLEVAAVLGARAEPWLVEAVLGDAEAGIDACVASGMLTHDGYVLSLRHELAREAVAAAVPPERRRRIHAGVLAALEDAPDAQLDLARLAHHAEEAHDAVAVLAYAPEAGRQAARLGAHREAVQQYARALRFAGDLPARERAPLLEAFAQAHPVIAHTSETLEAQAEAARLWRELEEPASEGAALARLSGLYVERGLSDEAEAANARALELLSALPPSRELGHAQEVQAALRMRAGDNEAAVAWGEKALATARHFKDAELEVRAHCHVAAGLLLLQEDEAGETHLAAARELAAGAGLRRMMALADVTAASIAVESYRFAGARRILTQGLATCREHDLDSDALYLRSLLALTDLHQGDWRAATEAADDVARGEGEAISRVMALLTLGRLRARRGDSGARQALDEALALAEPADSLQRLGPVRAARAEEAWLAGDPERAAREAEAVYELAVQHRHAWLVGELGSWLRRGGAEVTLPDWAAAPFRLEVGGDSDAEGAAAAAAAWRERGCPYEEARALAAAGSEAGLKRALKIFERLGAHPDSAAVARQLRELGAKAVPRGRRRKTRAHPAGLTPRQSQVLALLAKGLTNQELAETLHISPKTAGNHVSAVLAKLGVRRRAEAVAVALERGLVDGEDGQGGEAVVEPKARG